MTILIVAALVLLSGLSSGFTLGFMGLDVHELHRKASLGDKAALRVHRVRKDGNLLLVTLLLGNVVVNTALAIFLGSITAGVIAGVIATSLIVVFGEIIPQALFARHGLLLGARFIWLINIFIFLLFPIARPIASLLDKVLGNELPTVYSKGELLKIVEEHKYSDDSDVDDDEERIIRGALTFSSTSAKGVMTPMKDVYLLEEKAILTDERLREIREQAHSRVPIYKGNKDNVVGIVLIKNLLGRDLEECTAGDVMRDDIFFVKDTKCLDDIFEMFIKTHQHLFIVKNEEDIAVGVISFEDILEEIIREEIEDESDV